MLSRFAPPAVSQQPEMHFSTLGVTVGAGSTPGDLKTTVSGSMAGDTISQRWQTKGYEGTDFTKMDALLAQAQDHAATLVHSHAFSGGLNVEASIGDHGFMLTEQSLRIDSALATVGNSGVSLDRSGAALVAEDGAERRLGVGESVKLYPNSVAAHPSPDVVTLDTKNSDGGSAHVELSIEGRYDRSVAIKVDGQGASFSGTAVDKALDRNDHPLRTLAADLFA